MTNPEKIKEKAKKVLDKAELLYDHKQYDKASSEFAEAGDLYQSIFEYKIAEQCYYYAARSFLHNHEYLKGSNAMRNAANCCIMIDNYEKAADYYDISSKYALKDKNKREGEFRSILSACFAYLCWFLKGKQDKGLNYIKKIKSEVDPKEFSENRLTRLVKGLTLAIINKDDSVLQELENEFIHFKFRDSETKLIKDAILMAKTHLLLDFKLKIPQKSYEHENIISYFLTFNLERLNELKNDPYLNHNFKSFRIIDIGITQSDNLSTKETPNLPIDLNNLNVELELKTKANFPGKAYIGPIMFTIEIDKRLYFFAKTETVLFEIKSHPADLNITINPLTNPIINQTFPLEIRVYNPSEADVSNINIQFEFPQSLKLMRGTLQKDIFQLIRNEDFKWNISLKPLEPGIHNIKISFSFTDQDGIKVGPKVLEIPLEINL